MQKTSSVNETCLFTPLTPAATKVLLLGSGELGKELTIELQRYGVEVVACDSYANAPAMHVAHHSRIFDMKDPKELRRIVEVEKPTLIVPEIEALATTELLALEATGSRVIPTAQAAHITMNREKIRQLAAEELNLATAKYRFADNFEEFVGAASQMGFPCVVKPIMSSSGKGQSVVRGPADLAAAYSCSQTAGRAGTGRVIVEEFVHFESEITLLTVRAVNGTFFCAPIGHEQADGDYIFSWQPHFASDEQLRLAKEMAYKVTDRLGGFGVFGVEMFLLADNKVLFSEVSPRPHDTGMVTMATQKQSQFALHARAILGLPVYNSSLIDAGASAALRSHVTSDAPFFCGVGNALQDADVQVRLFGKPKAYPNRRMGVVLACADNTTEALKKVKSAHGKIEVKA